MALQSVEARCRAETDVAMVVAAVVAADTVVVVVAADALNVVVETAMVVVVAVEGVWLEARALAKKAK